MPVIQSDKVELGGRCVSDEGGQRWDGVDERQAIEQVLPEGDGEFSAGFHQAGKGIAALAAKITFGSAADFAFFDEVTNVGFAAVGMNGYIRALQDQEQFVLMAMQSFE